MPIGDIDKLGEFASVVQAGRERPGAIVQELLLILKTDYLPTLLELIKDHEGLRSQDRRDTSTIWAKVGERDIGAEVEELFQNFYESHVRPYHQQHDDQFVRGIVIELSYEFTFLFTGRFGSYFARLTDSWNVVQSRQSSLKTA